MKSSCCQSGVIICKYPDTHWQCNACNLRCDAYETVTYWVKHNKMTDDEALVEGIKLQNEKYEKLLKFVRSVAYPQNETHPLTKQMYAYNLLKEICE